VAPSVAKAAEVSPAKVGKSVGMSPAKVALVLPEFAPVVGTLDARIRAGYELATAKAAELWPGCGLRWTMLAGIGSIESANGAHIDGAIVVSGSGVVLPHIIGPPLDGAGGRSRIADTDGGLLDDDPALDHAVGPMQFIPSTWARHGRDANGDGVSDPHSIDDASLAAAGYLCAAGDLRDEDTLRRALFSYNHSDEYVASVRDQIMRFDAEFGGLVPTEPAPGTTELDPTTTTGSSTSSTTTNPTTTTTAPPMTTTTTTAAPTTTSSSTTTTTTTAAPATTTTEPPTTTSSAPAGAPA
jgi:hypothetical protein